MRFDNANEYIYGYMLIYFLFNMQWYHMICIS